MGFKFRKSINLGGGLKINVSKSGIGYSAGTKGLRVTKRADGRTSVRASVPGTGVSYEKTYGSSSRKRVTKTNSRNLQCSPQDKTLNQKTTTQNEDSKASGCGCLLIIVIIGVILKLIF